MPISPLLKLRVAQANFEKARQQCLEQERKVESLNAKLADALFTLQEAQEQQAAAINEPAQVQAASLLIEQKTALIQSLNNELDREENHLPARVEALEKARDTLNETEALLSQCIPHKILSAAPLQSMTPYPAHNDQPLLACAIDQSINDDDQAPSPFHFYTNDCQTLIPTTNGASDYDEGILLPVSTLGNYYDDLEEGPLAPPSTPILAAAPSPSTIQSLPAQWVLQRTYQQLSSLAFVALITLPASPT